MKNSTFLRSLLTLLVMAVWGGANGAMAQATYTHTFKTGDLGTASTVTTSPAGSKTLSNVTWDFTLTKKNDKYYLGWDNSKGVQIGSSKQPATLISLSTNQIPGTIISIEVNTSGASSVKATFSASVGETDFTSGGKSSVYLSSTATSYIFEGSAEGEILLSWENNSDKAIYIKSITIKYTSSSTSKTLQTIEFPETNYNAEIGTPFTSPTLEGAKTNVTYSSSDEGVATVDNSGNITLISKGTTTITATAEETDEYYSAEASYTLTVKEPLSAGTIWFEDFSSNSLDNYTIVDGESKTKIYTETIAGGASPEILIGKKTGSLTVNNLDLKGYTGTFILTFNSNNGISEITSTTNGVKVRKIKFAKPNGIYEVYVPEGTTSLNLTLANTSSSNTRVDNILLEHTYNLQALNISSVGYATFSTDKNFIMPEGVEGGIVTVDGATANVNYAYTYTDNIFSSDIVPAGTGLLMKGAQGEYKMYATTQEATEVYAENLLKGALTNDTINAPDDKTRLYIFANDSQSGLGFYWQKSSNNDNYGKWVKNMKGKAYLQVPTNSAVKGFRLNLGDTTGITAVESTLGNAPVYTLSGVRVNGSLNNLPAGIYIVGGKKVYVK